MYAYPVVRIYFIYHLLLLCYLVVYCVVRLLIPHENSRFREPKAQTTDGVIHSAEPSFLSSSCLTIARWDRVRSRLVAEHGFTRALSVGTVFVELLGGWILVGRSRGLWLCCMAFSASDVYRITADQLR